MTGPSPELVPLDAPTLVEASAGTGKTHAITTYFVRGILERGLSPDQILVVTYTKAATAELRMRARARITQALSLLRRRGDADAALGEVVSSAVNRLGAPEVERRLRTALGLMDQAAISTIHGFCQRLLQDHPLSFGIGLDLTVDENVRSLHAELASDFWAIELHEAPEWFLQTLGDRNVGPDELAKLANVATMPGAEITGPEPAEIDAHAVEDVLRLHREAARIWFDDRDAILERLRTKGLSKNVYRAASIENKWVPALDELFEQPSSKKLPTFFRRLCPTQMQVNKGYQPPKHAFFDACEALLDAHERIRPMLDFAVYSFRRRFCDFVRERSRERRESHAIFSFDELLTTVHSALRGHDEGRSRPGSAAVAETVRRAYPLALVDEFQDTDSIQYGIFRAIYGEGSAVYVGDPKQAIYAFRGADVFSYLRAAGEVEGRRHTLQTNRRSDPGVVRAVNALFSQRSPPFAIDRIDFNPAEAHACEDRSTLSPPLEVVFLSTDELKRRMTASVAKIAANEIGLLLASSSRIEGRPVEPGDLAVLCRSNKQASAVTKALRELNIPTSLDGDASVLNTEIAADLRAVLEAVLMPGDSRLIRRALLTRLIGVTPYELSSMEDPNWSAWVSLFWSWNEAWHETGVLRAIEEMLGQTQAEMRIASSPTARRELTDLLHLQELLLRGERQRQRDPVALMQWFRRLNSSTPDEGMVAIEDLQQRPDAQSGAVRVTTLHKSKGLEYGIVFCPFTWGDARLSDFDRKAVKFHDEDDNLKIDLGSENVKAHLEASTRENLSEALRLLYVGVTRAKYRCTLFWGPGQRWRDSALAYLLHGDVLDSLTEDAMRADVESFVAASEGSAGWRTPRGARADRWRKYDTEGIFEARPRTRAFDQTARIASFTSLTGHDEEPRGSAAVETTSPLFSDFPGGARTGLLLHAILERLDLGELEGNGARDLVSRQLTLHGFDRALEESLREDLAVAASIPLLPDVLPPLVGLNRDRQLRELEFTLAVSQPNLGELAELLRDHGAPNAAPEYAERLERVGGQRLRGFLRGFIDLMFEWDGRWYVADYKSNKLSTYEPPDVLEAVQREHYVLQGLLYSAAAHRYLRRRLPEYDPERHWGGALFLFLRGMVGPSGAGSSVFYDRQTPALLDALDHWLGGRDGSR